MVDVNNILFCFFPINFLCKESLTSHLLFIFPFSTNLSFCEAFSVNAFLKGLKKALPKKHGLSFRGIFSISFLAQVLSLEKKVLGNQKKEKVPNFYIFVLVFTLFWWLSATHYFKRIAAFKRCSIVEFPSHCHRHIISSWQVFPQIRYFELCLECVFTRYNTAAL